VFELIPHDPGSHRGLRRFVGVDEVAATARTRPGTRRLPTRRARLEDDEAPSALRLGVPLDLDELTRERSVDEADLFPDSHEASSAGDDPLHTGDVDGPFAARIGSPS
jgi:hypothetical protein